MNFDITKYAPYLIAAAAGLSIVTLSYFIPLRKGSEAEVIAEEVIKYETGDNVDLSKYERLYTGTGK